MKPRAERLPPQAGTLCGVSPQGRLCFREPTKPLHGLPVAEYREMMLQAGLSEARAREYKVFPIGWVFDAVFVKGVSGMWQNPSE